MAPVAGGKGWWWLVTHAVPAFPPPLACIRPLAASLATARLTLGPLRVEKVRAPILQPVVGDSGSVTECDKFLTTNAVGLQQLAILIELSIFNISYLDIWKLFTAIQEATDIQRFPPSHAPCGPNDIFVKGVSQNQIDGPKWAAPEPEPVASPGNLLSLPPPPFVVPGPSDIQSECE
ncbi:hypothetical protein DFJ73DRAFT_771102 [Zopfochytrium polystomum]|nr:hypothetical protein DFJ73DRAFT_771102 [Zopfochytrium polystomum]